MIKLPILLTCLFVLGAASAQAQTELEDKALTMRPDPQNPVGENLKVPPAWKVRLDKPDPDVVIGSEEEGSDIRFVSMTPGWHITTGPRAIYYHPASTAEGEFVARAGIYLFPPGDRNEAYGLFVGGKNLDGAEQRYLYFLVRRSGEFLIKERRGGETEVVHEWTASDAVNPYTEETSGTVKNVLSIDAGEEFVVFRVNDTEVARLPRTELDVDGIVGLRINHALNVHVDDFAVEFPDSM
ncbi:MAG: hypothetical protein R3282_03150 [Rhodothermales bacterium]|nr:hypothetical protein [Rhodothermales bacterium]